MYLVRHRHGVVGQGSGGERVVSSGVTTDVPGTDLTTDVSAGIAMVSLDKALEVNLLSALLGDNVEIKCDVTGSPTPRVIWKR